MKKSKLKLNRSINVFLKYFKFYLKRFPKFCNSEVMNERGKQILSFQISRPKLLSLASY